MDSWIRLGPYTNGVGYGRSCEGVGLDLRTKRNTEAEVICHQCQRDPDKHDKFICQQAKYAKKVEVDRDRQKKEARAEVTRLRKLAQRYKEALQFYADPETYFAIAFLGDPPCGEFRYDFSETELGEKPGKRSPRCVKGGVMANLDPLMSSTKSDWCTPNMILDLVREVGLIGLDPCASYDGKTGARRSFCGPPNHKDGLKLKWKVNPGEVVYVNPPYGRAIGPWVERCSKYGLCNLDSHLIALLPARTDTSWWQNNVTTASAVCFWRGRLKFVGAENGAPFPSAIAYWGVHEDKFYSIFAKHGWVVIPR